MLVNTAMTADDLLRAVDYNADTRSRGCTPNLTGFDNKRGILDTITRCSGSANSWVQRVQLVDYNIILDLLEEEEPEEIEEEEIEEELEEPEEGIIEEAPEEIEEEPEEETKEASIKRYGLDWNQVKTDLPEVLESDIRVSCNCPAFAMTGPAYIVDSLDAGEITLRRYKNAPIPEGRFPDIRSPNLENTLCKHIIAVLRKYFI